MLAPRRQGERFWYLQFKSNRRICQKNNQGRLGTTLAGEAKRWASESSVFLIGARLDLHYWRAGTDAPGVGKRVEC